MVIPVFHTQERVPENVHEDPRRSTRDLWHEHVGQSTSLYHILIIVSFLATFGLARLTAYGIREGWMPVGDVSGGGVHIHHYVWGIGLLLIVGYVQIIIRPHWGRAVSAVLFGIAEGLILDEFDLLINLRDVYWQKERESFVAVAVAGSLLLLIFFLRTFFVAVFRERRR